MPAPTIDRGTNSKLYRRALNLPFYPMRPRRGPDIDAGRIKKILEEIDGKKFVVQPKLNGDRVLLAVRKDEVQAANRHGSWYTKRVRNAGDFVKLGIGTVLDGEVFGGEFFPFEALA